jgi:hypothetical protein
VAAKLRDFSRSAFYPEGNASPAESVRPIEAAPGDELDAFAIATGEHPITIMCLIS